MGLLLSIKLVDKRFIIVYLWMWHAVHLGDLDWHYRSVSIKQSVFLISYLMSARVMSY